MVLVQLLLTRGAVVPTERIVERLCPTGTPSIAQASLHAYVARPRRVLEPDRLPRTPARLLFSAPYHCVFHLEQDAVDAWLLERRVAACSPPPSPAGAAVEGLGRSARRVGRAAVRGALEGVHRTARERLTAARPACGQSEQAFADAGALTREQPLHEEGWRLLALVPWGPDCQGDAMVALRRARRASTRNSVCNPGAVLL
ncbi:BTAD domain-containing putative transcriptional regulator [Streptomyces virginiae]|uniref:AfsR/SARP family transcriptional regulator n=1 Tax=Streptomyces virginiae TaxID=1961 RepID=UPI0036FFB8E9